MGCSQGVLPGSNDGSGIDRSADHGLVDALKPAFECVELVFGVNGQRLPPRVGCFGQGIQNFFRRFRHRDRDAQGYTSEIRRQFQGGQGCVDGPILFGGVQEVAAGQELVDAGEADVAAGQQCFKISPG